MVLNGRANGDKAIHMFDRQRSSTGFDGQAGLFWHGEGQVTAAGQVASWSGLAVSAVN